VRTATLRQMENLNMDRAAPILIRIYKEERTLEVWKQDRTERFALLKSYPLQVFRKTRAEARPGRLPGA
jgi:murein L,D-transpeptidase YafK